MQELAAAMQNARDSSEFWILAQSALLRFVRRAARKYPYLADEAAADIAAAKTLELFLKFDDASWKPADAEPAEIAAYIATVAKNGLVDHVRRDARYVRGTPAGEDLDATNRTETSSAPHLVHEQALFLDSLCACLDRLTSKAKRLWILRVLYGVPSKHLARHPLVASTPQAVDMSLSRSRGAVRACLQKKGLQSDALPEGTFFRLWLRIRGEVDP